MAWRGVFFAVISVGGASGFAPRVEVASSAGRTPAARAAPVRSTATDYVLPPALQTIVESLKSLPDDKYRYKQLLFMAGSCDPIAPDQKTPENKVPGCLSTVHVAARLEGDKVFYTGDSDGQLTKGLLTMLVKGLSGSTTQQIRLVKPDFIRDAGIAASLTPGRNNGFVNMLAVMQAKAQDLGDAPVVADGAGKEAAPAVKGVVLEMLSCLKPTSVEFDEAALSLTIVAEAFDGFEAPIRRQIVETLLKDILKDRLADLDVAAFAPSEPR